MSDEKKVFESMGESIHYKESVQYTREERFAVAFVSLIIVAKFMVWGIFLLL